MQGTKKIQKQIPLTFCQMMDHIDNQLIMCNSPAFWRCDYKRTDPDLDISFEGCYQFMCNEHCRKYTPRFPKGYMG